MNASNPEVSTPPRFEESLGHLIRRSQQLHTLRWTAELGTDLTGPQYALLSAINTQPNLDQKTAGALASLDKSTTADVITRLQRNGWIRRERSVDDARRSVLTLSPPSRSALPEVTLAVRRVQEGLVGVLAPAERPRFVQLLARVAYAGDVPTSPVPGEDLVLGLSTTPGHLLRRAEQVHQRLWSRDVGSQLTPSQYALLAAIAEQPNDQTSAGLRASLDKSSAADIASRLYRRHLIEIEIDPTDKRRKVLSLSATAAELLTSINEKVGPMQRDLLAPLDAAEQRELLALLRRVAYQPS